MRTNGHSAGYLSKQIWKRIKTVANFMEKRQHQQPPPSWGGEAKRQARTRKRSWLRFISSSFFYQLCFIFLNIYNLLLLSLFHTFATILIFWTYFTQFCITAQDFWEKACTFDPIVISIPRDIWNPLIFFILFPRQIRKSKLSRSKFKIMLTSIYHNSGRILLSYSWLFLVLSFYLFPFSWNSNRQNFVMPKMIRYFYVSLYWMLVLYS